MTSTELTIDRLDESGRGVGTLAGDSVAVTGAIPGDLVEIAPPTRERGHGATASARLLRIVAPSPDRASPPCRHFGVCGGCAVQHLADAAYLSWKAGRILGHLTRAGVDTASIALGPWVRTDPGQRRRVDLTFEKRQPSVSLGLNERGSHRIVDLIECPILLPELASLIEPLRELIGQDDALGSYGEIVLNRLDSGIDLTIVPAARRPLELAARRRLASFAVSHQLLRISWGQRGEAETILQRVPATVAFGDIAIEVPPAGFLQASLPAESSMQAVVQRWTTGAKRIVDLYGGLGTLSLPLLATSRVHIVEGDRRAVAAVDTGLRRAGRLGRATVEHRDLARDPYQSAELTPFDSAIIDPPRAGALSQAEQLAGSPIKTVIGVSCNPVTFARDAAVLAKGGFSLKELIPIDQFLWSPHIELIALFTRGGTRLRRPGATQSRPVPARRPAS